MNKGIFSFTLIFSFIFLSPQLYAESVCKPVLWPTQALLSTQDDARVTDVMNLLAKSVKNALRKRPTAIPVLASAGKTNANDETLIHSRIAMREADDAAVLALAYTFTNNNDYLQKTREILLKWATVNKPTGHPINETRLAGFIWAYDLVHCQLSAQDVQTIQSWLNTLYANKKHWRFGAITKNNNHSVHQYKMLVMLDKILGNQQNLQNDVNQLTQLATINLNPKTGQSLDYTQRSSLYYHNYVLQPWLEIVLVTGQDFPSVDKAYKFLMARINKNQIKGEFTHSSAKIDKQRANGGFAYAKPNSNFDISRTATTQLAFYTAHCKDAPAKLDTIMENAKPSAWLAFLKARQLIWNSCQKHTDVNGSIAK